MAQYIVDEQTLFTRERFVFGFIPVESTLSVTPRLLVFGGLVSLLRLRRRVHKATQSLIEGDGPLYIGLLA